MQPPIPNSTVPCYQQPQPITHVPQKETSCVLTALGTILFVFSVTTLGLAAWASSFTVRPYYAYGSLGCSVFFLLTSLLGMYGGNDVANRKSYIILALVFGIFGVIVGCVGTVLSFMACFWYMDCKACGEKVSVNCPTDCSDTNLAVYFGLGLLTSVQVFSGLGLSCCAFCNMFCQRAPNNFVVYPTPVTNFIYTSTQAQDPPPYKHLEGENSDIYAPNLYSKF